MGGERSTALGVGAVDKNDAKVAGWNIAATSSKRTALLGALNVIAQSKEMTRLSEGSVEGAV